MSTFVLHLQSATQYERLDAVESFVGQDASGSFGILAGHTRAMTCLTFGLARFRGPDQPWRYLALPGAVLYFAGNQLYVNAPYYVFDADVRRIQSALAGELLRREQRRQGLRDRFARLEEQLRQRLWIGRRES